MSKKKEAPKVTRQEVQAAIRKATYTILPDGLTTVCQLTLDNGFSVHGTSACVSKENFVRAEGERLAYERAFNKAWEFLGFRLAERLHQKKLRKARGPRYRDSESGMYVTAAYAKLNPKTTQREI